MLAHLIWRAFCRIVFMPLTSSLLQAGQGRQLKSPYESQTEWERHDNRWNNGQTWKAAEMQVQQKRSRTQPGVFPISRSTCTNSLFLQHLAMRNEEIIWLPLWRSSCQENPHPARGILANMIKMCILQVQQAEPSSVLVRKMFHRLVLNFSSSNSLK